MEPATNKCYIAIDLKSFYASVECVERGLNPLTARLVVADYSRTEKTICLAVSPALKKILGVGGRARLYEVLDKARRKQVDFEAAPPQMRRYVEVSRQIYKIYTRFVAAEDIHPYSIDEVFIDVTDYLKMYGVSPRELAERMIYAVLDETGITATAGIGTNLYLAKIAMDIKAKHMTADRHGVRIAELDEMAYRKELWGHKPMTDFWRYGPGIVRRLGKLGIHTMGELARYSIAGASKLYEEFGVNAELIIDHAWGWEPVTMREVKQYESDNHSLSSGQVLHRPYNFDEARLVTWEMADDLALKMYEKQVATDSLELYIGYDRDNHGYAGAMDTDYYGRKVPKPSHGRAKLKFYTNSEKAVTAEILGLFDKLCSQDLLVRRIGISALNIRQRKTGEDLSFTNSQMDLFTDYNKCKADEEKAGRLAEAEIAIKRKFGKNAILRAANYEEPGTMRERNMQIGGHRA